MAENVSKCRLCATNDGVFCIPIDENNPNTLNHKIFKCLGTRIERNDSNRKICAECTFNINKVYNQLCPSKEIPDTEPLSENVLDESSHSSEATIAKPESVESEEFGSNIVTLKNVNAASTPNQVQVVENPLVAKKKKRKTGRCNSCKFCERKFVYFACLCRHVYEKHEDKLFKIETAKGALPGESFELETNVAEIWSNPKRKTSKPRERRVAKQPHVQKQPRLRPTGERRRKSPIQSAAATSSPRASTPSFRPSPAQKAIRAEVKSTATISPGHPSRNCRSLRFRMFDKTFVSRMLDETDLPSNEDSVNLSDESFDIA